MEQEELKSFIHFLTHNKNLSKLQLRKIEDLIVRDSVLIEKEYKPQKTSSKDETVRYHNPKGIISFLSLFSIDDSLKWYTHKWDKSEPFPMEDLIKNAPINHNKLRRFCFGDDNKGVPAQLFYHVWNFINPNANNKPVIDQFGNVFQTKWADVSSWCSKHPGCWPGKFITKEGKSFESDINRFKRTIEFRTDVEPDQKFGFQIKSHIRKVLNGAVKIVFSDRFDKIGRNMKFYCNVKAVYMGISKLCDWVASYKAMGDTLFIDLDIKDDCLIFSALHKGSKMTGSENRINGLSGDFKSIREILFSACDFDISGRFNDDLVKIIALDKKSCMKGSSIITPTIIAPLSSGPDGVCYTLKFYML